MSKINKSRLIQVIAIGFILVLCPAASWYYLQKGLDYQKESRKELAQIKVQNTGDLIPEHIKNDSFLLDKKLRLVIFNRSNNQKMIKQITEKLFDQFESSGGFFMIEFVDSSMSSSSETTVVENDIHIVKQVSTSEYNEILQNIYGLPLYEEIDGRVALKDLQKGGSSIQGNEVYAYLIDEKNHVRNVYNLLEEARVKRMVEHTAILIPKLDKEEVELRREKEI